MRRRTDPMAEELAALDELEVEVRRAPSSSRNMSLIVPILITLVVMTGAVTIAWYSYTAGVKEGSEEAAPLLRPQGPMKVAPANPGGLNIPHQEKTVFNAIDGKKTDRKVERLLPPPERPMPIPTIGTGDKTLKSRSRAADRAEGPASPGAAPIPSAPLTPPVVGRDVRTAPVTPPAPPASKQAKEPPVAGSTKAAKPTVAKPQAVKPKPVKPKAATPLTPPKPPAVALAKPPEKRAAPPPPKAVGKGAYRIQIGSVSTDVQARKFWTIHASKNGDLLGKLAMHVQKATIKGRTYYRIQAGPLADRGAAQSLCGKLKSRQIGCIVVSPK